MTRRVRELPPTPLAKGFSPVLKRARDYDTETRREFAEKGWALPDGSFPIKDCKDVQDAVHRAHQAKDPEAARAHIKKRWRELKCGGTEPFSTSKGSSVDWSEVERLAKWHLAGPYLRKDDAIDKADELAVEGEGPWVVVEDTFEDGGKEWRVIHEKNVRPGDTVVHRTARRSSRSARWGSLQEYQVVLLDPDGGVYDLAFRVVAYSPDHAGALAVEYAEWDWRREMRSMATPEWNVWVSPGSPSDSTAPGVIEEVPAPVSVSPSQGWRRLSATDPASQAWPYRDQDGFDTDDEVDEDVAVNPAQDVGPHRRRGRTVGAASRAQAENEAIDLALKYGEPYSVVRIGDSYQVIRSEDVEDESVVVWEADPEEFDGGSYTPNVQEREE